jgi:hypothetical protein
MDQVVGKSEPGDKSRRKHTMTIDGKSPNVQDIDDTSIHDRTFDGSGLLKIRTG